MAVVAAKVASRHHEVTLMSFAAWLGRSLVLILVGALGYYLSGFAVGLFLGAKIVAGEMTLEEISSGTTAWAINTLAVFVGGGLGYFAAFHRPVMRWNKGKRVQPQPAEY